MKKILSLVLCAVMSASMLCMLTGCGEKGSEGLEYESNGDGTCSVMGIGTCKDTDIVIPSKSPDGDKVTSVADEAFKSTDIKTVSMADTVTRIGTEAFWSCGALENVELSGSLKSIGSKAFAECENIVEINLPDSLEEFERTLGTNGEAYEGSSTFSGCDNLKKINIPKKLKAIYSDTFENTSLTEIEIEADYKYGHFDVQFMSELGYYLPALYLDDPKLEDEDIIEITGSVKTVLYAKIFGDEGIEINGEKIAVPKAQSTKGFYGSQTETDAFEITDDGKIELKKYSNSSEKYETAIYYSDSSEMIFDFEFDNSYGAYTYKNSQGKTVRFVVYDNYLFIEDGYAQSYTLGTEYKG